MTKKTNEQINPDKILDCLGLFCPEPIYRTRVEIDKLGKGKILEVVADDPAAEGDITSLVKRLNIHLLAVRREEDGVHLLIKK